MAGMDFGPVWLTLKLAGMTVLILLLVSVVPAAAQGAAAGRALLWPPLAFIDPVLMPGMFIRSQHVAELRNAVK